MLTKKPTPYVICTTAVSADNRVIITFASNKQPVVKVVM